MILDRTRDMTIFGLMSVFNQYSGAFVGSKWVSKSLLFELTALSFALDLRLPHKDSDRGEPAFHPFAAACTILLSLDTIERDVVHFLQASTSSEVSVPRIDEYLALREGVLGSPPMSRTILREITEESVDAATAQLCLSTMGISPVQLLDLGDKWIAKQREAQRVFESVRTSLLTQIEVDALTALAHDDITSDIDIPSMLACCPSNEAVRLVTSLNRVLSFTCSELAAIGIDVPLFKRVLCIRNRSLPAGDAGTLTRLIANNPAFAMPFVLDGERIALVDLWSFHQHFIPRVSKALASNPKAQRRFHRRIATYVQKRSTRCLRSLVGPKFIAENVYFRDGDRRYEIDIVLSFGDSVLFVEAKSGYSTAPLGKKDSVTRYYGNLRRVQGDALEQLGRIRQHLSERSSITLEDRHGQRLAILEPASVKYILVTLHPTSLGGELTQLAPRACRASYVDDEVILGLHDLSLSTEILRDYILFYNFLDNALGVLKHAAQIGTTAQDLLGEYLIDRLLSRKRDIATMYFTSSNDGWSSEANRNRRLANWIVYREGLLDHEVMCPEAPISPAERSLLDGALGVSQSLQYFGIFLNAPFDIYSFVSARAWLGKALDLLRIPYYALACKYYDFASGGRVGVLYVNATALEGGLSRPRLAEIVKKHELSCASILHAQRPSRRKNYANTEHVMLASLIHARDLAENDE